MKTKEVEVVQNSNGQATLLMVLDDNNKWFTSKELRQILGKSQIATINRCLRKLVKYHFIEKRDNKNPSNGREYIYRSIIWTKK